MIVSRLSHLILSFLLLSIAWAEENLGQLDIEEVLLQPQLYLVEPFHGQFQMNDSYFKLRWQKGSTLSAYIGVGSHLLRNQPVFYTRVPSEDLSLFEAYAQLKGVYGRIRAGYIPLEFGAEGKLSEAQTIFPRTLLFFDRIVGLRDLGFSYTVSHNNYYSHMSFHNGEGDKNVDGTIWMTGSWGWNNQKNLDIGFSGQTGKTNLRSTSTNHNTLASVDPTQEAKWTMGNIYIHWHPNKWDLVLEYLMGKKTQETNKEGFVTSHFDISFQLANSLRGHLRADYLDPNNTLKDDSKRKVSLGLSWADQHLNSVVSIIGVKVMEEKTDRVNDELYLQWKLTPKLF